MTAARRWRQPDALPFTTPALERLRANLDALHFLAYPHTPTTPALGVGSRSQWTESAMPDAQRVRYRRAFKRIDARIDSLASDVARAVSPEEPDAPRRGWRCAHCRIGQRAGAVFCDRCGKPRPSDLPDHNREKDH